MGSEIGTIAQLMHAGGIVGSEATRVGPQSNGRRIVVGTDHCESQLWLIVVGGAEEARVVKPLATNHLEGPGLGLKVLTCIQKWKNSLEITDLLKLAYFLQLNKEAIDKFSILTFSFSMVVYSQA